MNNLIAESIKDLEFILTEWEGDTNALLGAVRVNARLDRITPILTAIAEKTREETLWEVSTEVHKMTNKYEEGYMAAVVDVKSILASLDADKESK